MSVTVKVPTQLRVLTQGEAEVAVQADTVRSAIDALETRFPGLSSRLLDESGSLRRFVNLYVDDEDVRFLRGLDTEVVDGGRLAIIPAVAGGGV